MESFFYSGKNRAVNGWATFKSLWSLAAIAKGKREELDRLLTRIQPDVAVIDSEYTVSPLRRQRIPIVALNTSEMVVNQYLKSHHPPATRSHFWFVEFTDYLFHKHFCDLVLSPFPLSTPTRHRRFRRIGLIARRRVRDQALIAQERQFPAPRDLRSVVFMLSGSVHASNITFERHNLPFRIDVVGRSGESRGNLIYHGRQMDNTHLLAAADALVINAGYSAVSEAFVLRKPVFVVPVPGHAEQSVNAELVRDLGLGFVATEEDVLPQLLSMYQQNRWVGLKPMPPVIETNGAQQAAQAILSLAARRTGRQSTSSLMSRSHLGSHGRAA
jgi:UDP:flavonoid glycosyltransferase YjiC (YdhE family)